MKLNRRGMLAIALAVVALPTVGLAAQPAITMEALGSHLKEQLGIALVIEKMVHERLPAYLSVSVWVDQDKRRLQLQYDFEPQDIDIAYGVSEYLAIRLARHFQCTVAEIWDPTVTRPPDRRPDLVVAFRPPPR